MKPLLLFAILTSCAPTRIHPEDMAECASECQRKKSTVEFIDVGCTGWMQCRCELDLSLRERREEE